MEIMHYLLGIDGGATKTALLLADQDGRSIAKVKVDAISLHHATPSEIEDRIRVGIKELLKTAKLPGTTKFKVVVAGIAGLDTPKDKKLSETALKRALKSYTGSKSIVKVVNDIIIGFWSGSKSQEGIAIIGGTGSNGYGRSKKGVEVKASGMGYLLADQGSGYEAGRNILRTVIKAHDGREKPTVLTKLILDHYKIKDIYDLPEVVYQPGYGKKQIGELAYFLEVGVKMGDKVARKLANEIVDQQIEIVQAVAKKLRFTKHSQFDVVMIGGMLQRDPYISKRFKQQVKALYPKAQPIVPELSPVEGAICYAQSLSDK